MTIEAQIDRLGGSVAEFAQCIESLSDDEFLARLDAWSPRDILAHLLGWNRYTIQGAEEIRSEKTPFYLSDPGEDFSKVNAVLLKEYPSQEKGQLLDELRASTQELRQYLHSLDPDDWNRDFGVRHEGYPITIRDSVDALIDDYVDHRKQIEEWAGLTHKA